MILGSGATDLLIEWEDMFPYWGPIANISAKWVTLTMNVTINMTKTMARKTRAISNVPYVLGIPTQKQRSLLCSRSLLKISILFTCCWYTGCEGKWPGSDPPCSGLFCLPCRRSSITCHPLTCDLIFFRAFLLRPLVTLSLCWSWQSFLTWERTPPTHRCNVIPFKLTWLFSQKHYQQYRNWSNPCSGAMSFSGR